MKEYIEREATQTKIKELCEKHNISYGGTCGSFGDEISKITDTVPSADVQKVRHGEWINNPNDVYWGNFRIRKQCSICGAVPEYSKSKEKYLLSSYCRCCGAKMDKE